MIRYAYSDFIFVVKQTINGCKSITCYTIINKGYFSEAFLFKPRGGRSPPSGLNRKPRKILYLACSMAQAQINMCY